VSTRSARPASGRGSERQLPRRSRPCTAGTAADACKGLRNARCSTSATLTSA
ncbi:unnamed protein product, partial [Effrenium voratum]